MDDGDNQSLSNMDHRLLWCPINSEKNVSMNDAWNKSVNVEF